MLLYKRSILMHAHFRKFSIFFRLVKYRGQHKGNHKADCTGNEILGQLAVQVKQHTGDCRDGHARCSKAHDGGESTSTAAAHACADEGSQARQVATEDQRLGDAKGSRQDLGQVEGLLLLILASYPSASGQQLLQHRTVPR